MLYAFLMYIGLNITPKKLDPEMQARQNKEQKTLD